MIVSIGCSRDRMLVLPADKTVVPLAAGSIYTNALPGYFVPKARMLEILDRLSERDVFDNHTKE